MTLCFTGMRPVVEARDIIAFAREQGADCPDPWPGTPLHEPQPLGNLSPGSLSFCTQPSLPAGLSGPALVFCRREAGHAPGITRLTCDNPRLLFGQCVTQFFAPEPDTGIHPTALVDETADIGADVSIGPYCSIGPQTKIGAGTRIRAQVTIAGNTKIGEDCVILSGSVIAEPGFGVEFDANGHSHRLPHIGGVVLEDRVQVGSQCSIAAGTLTPTHIGHDTQLDNKVHVAHNVIIGPRSLITACAEISGSVTIGADCWLGPNASVMNKITIGDGTLIGLGTVVTKSVPAGVIAAGTPAKVLRKR